MAAERSSARPPTLGHYALLACLIVVAFLGTLTSPFHPSSAALVVAVGVAALVVAVLRLSRSAPEPSPAASDAALRRGVVVWSTLLLALLAWQGYAYVRQPDRSIAHYDYPTLSTLLDPLLEQGPGRFAGWLAWLAAGYLLVRR